MNIKINEFKKVVSSPTIIGLLILFIVFNSFIILQNTDIKDELETLNNIVGKFGYEIDDEMTVSFKDYYDEGLQKLNKITDVKESKKYKNVSDFYDDHTYGFEDIYSKEEVKFINELGIAEAYYYEIQKIENVYENINLAEMAEGQIKMNQLSGKAADTVRKQYKDLDKRFDELLENKEHKSLFFLGKVYKMHSMLFRSLFKTIIFEIMILVVLITAYLVNYEFENNTEHTSYATKRGRNFILDKLCVVIFSNMLVVSIILITSLSLYFMNFNYSEFWSIPISSYFNTEYNLPHISWWNISFVQYLFSSIGLIYASTLVFTGIAFIISRSIKNSYTVFFIFAMILGFFLLTPGVGPTDSNIIFMGAFNPFALAMYPQNWFMESGALTSFKYYEFITIATWVVLSLVLGVLSIKKFKIQDM